MPSPEGPAPASPPAGLDGPALALYEALRDEQQWLDPEQAAEVAYFAVRVVEARSRAQVAEEIARAIEVAKGFRCPECGEPPETWMPQAHCAAGHHWQWSSKTRVDASAIAREHARTEEDPDAR